MPTGVPRRIEQQAVEEAISDPASRRILSTCIGEPRSVRDISDATDIPLASTYRRVKSLQDAGMLVVDRSAISADGRKFDMYRSRVSRARLQVARSGVSVTWRVDESVEDRLNRMWEQMRS